MFPPSSHIIMSQQYIEKVFTTIVSSSSPDVRGHGQPIESPPIISCFYCGEMNHISKFCPSKLDHTTSVDTTHHQQRHQPHHLCADVSSYIMFTSC